MRYSKNQQRDFTDRFLGQLRTLLLDEVRQEYAPVLEKVDVLQRQVDSLTDRVAGLEQSLVSAKASTSAPDVPKAQGSLSQAAPTGQFARLVYGLATDKMQDQDDADKAERAKKEKNAILRRFEQADSETTERLKQQVDTLLSKTMGTSIICVSAQRVKARASGTATPLVAVQFQSKHDKMTVFKARRKLADSRVGMDDDLSRLQQERRNAAWPKFKECKEAGIRTQWRAERKRKIYTFRRSLLRTQVLYRGAQLQAATSLETRVPFI